MRALILQPLPELVWDHAFGYSEFASLGVARMSEDLRELGVHVEVRYPRTEAEVLAVDGAQADVVVVGDFRYYAYFANPAPLVARTIEILLKAWSPTDLVVAGRHSAWFGTVAGGAAICHTYAALADRLTNGRWSVLHPGKGQRDALPDPGVPAIECLDDGSDMPGSFSRPTVRLGQLLLTKGCPFTCAFCEKAGSAQSTMSPDELDRAVGALVAHGFCDIAFWDEVFGWPLAAHGDHLAVLKNHHVAFNCNTRLGALQAPEVAALAEAGCRQILFGLELSPGESEAALTLGLDKGKNQSLDRVRRQVDLLREHGISPVGSLIIGLPHDSEEAIRARVQVAEELELSHCYVRPLVPFPESKLYRDLRAASQVRDFESWGEELDSFPHGYPTVSSLSRELIAEICGR